MMLQITNLSITHTRDLRVLIEDFSFTLNPGDKAALIGEEGNGKSTLLRLIHDPVLVEDYVSWNGAVSGQGRTAYLAQEPLSSELIMPVFSFLQDGISPLRFDPGEAARQAALMGLDSSLIWDDRPLGTCSGGEQVKLRLLHALLSEPDTLLLDEPSNDLDLPTLEWLEGFIVSTSLPTLFVSHDETLLSRTANVIVLFEQLWRRTESKWTVSRQGYDAFIGQRQYLFARQTQKAAKEQAEYEKQQARYRQIRDKVDHQLNTVSRQDPATGRLLKKKMASIKATGARMDKQHETQTRKPDQEESINLFFDNTVSLPQGKVVLDYHCPELRAGGSEDGPLLSRDVRLYVQGPEKIGIVGRNGAGKTTLLRQISAELLARKDIRAGLMPQDYREVMDAALDPVSFVSPDGDSIEHDRIRSWMGSANFSGDEMNHPLGNLSGGQKAKLFFLRLIHEGANVLILDEPTRNLSPLSNPAIREMLIDYRGAIIAVSHDRRYLAEVCDRLLELTPEGLLHFELPEASGSSAP